MLAFLCTLHRFSDQILLFRCHICTHVAFLSCVTFAYLGLAFITFALVLISLASLSVAFLSFATAALNSALCTDAFISFAVATLLGLASLDFAFLSLARFPP